ncbi:toll/interleukin-1 receptor domain-containing protein [Chryseolinea lacunae]|uniref:Toll/interleukin-1 receptor domain-containing protein n=1 Tax=Chryseolinea lacunae TaxID=2801331 RepID=A0ABS1L461_9BACT|nr:toll/interleukin-1 receptor domain-containing protein [Chryseolinea lacunae]MBL0745356.1 toll/interleukin-1 receptor domain-containing protein [Chryseolinea lacunae]
MIFICYSKADSIRVSAFVKQLLEEQISIWYDSYSINPGQDFSKEIQNGISLCSSFLVFQTSSLSANSTGVKVKEIKLAVNKALGDPSFKIIRALLDENTFDPFGGIEHRTFDLTWFDHRHPLLQRKRLRAFTDYLRNLD